MSGRPYDLVIRTAPFTLAAIAFAAACSSSSSSPGKISAGPDASGAIDGARGDGSTPEDDAALDAGASEAAAIDAALGPHATVRVGNFSYPAFDFDVCFSTTSIDAGAAWIGPMLHSTETFIATGNLSRYVYPPPGVQAIRFVLRDSASCGGTVEGIPDLPIAPLAENSRTTLIFSGTGFGYNDGGGAPYQVFAFPDEVVADDGGNRVRFVNLAQVGPLDVYAYPHLGDDDATSCALLFSKIAYGQAGHAQTVPGDGGPTDDSGYTPLNGESLGSFTFGSIGYVTQGSDCSKPYLTCYETDDVSHGAWTLYVYSEHTVFCRDDGNESDPYCKQE